jgi:hypothetical protein
MDLRLTRRCLPTQAPYLQGHTCCEISSLEIHEATSPPQKHFWWRKMQALGTKCCFAYHRIPGQSGSLP